MLYTHISSTIYRIITGKTDNNTVSLLIDPVVEMGEEVVRDVGSNSVEFNSQSAVVDSSPKSPFGQITSPMKKAFASMQSHLEEVGHFTKLDPQDDWLPITESRNGNAYHSAFHTLSSGIGFQALLLPYAFTTLGW